MSRENEAMSCNAKVTQRCADGVAGSVGRSRNSAVSANKIGEPNRRGESIKSILPGQGVALDANLGLYGRPKPE